MAEQTRSYKLELKMQVSGATAVIIQQWESHLLAHSQPKFNPFYFIYFPPGSDS